MSCIIFCILCLFSRSISVAALSNQQLMQLQQAKEAGRSAQDDTLRNSKAYSRKTWAIPLPCPDGKQAYEKITDFDEKQAQKSPNGYVWAKKNLVAVMRNFTFLPAKTTANGKRCTLEPPPPSSNSTLDIFFVSEDEADLMQKCGIILKDSERIKQPLPNTDIQFDCMVEHEIPRRNGVVSPRLTCKFHPKNGHFWVWQGNCLKIVDSKLEELNKSPKEIDKEEYNRFVYEKVYAEYKKNINKEESWEKYRYQQTENWKNEARKGTPVDKVKNKYKIKYRRRNKQKLQGEMERARLAAKLYELRKMTTEHWIPYKKPDTHIEWLAQTYTPMLIVYLIITFMNFYAATGRGYGAYMLPTKKRKVKDLKRHRRPWLSAEAKAREARKLEREKKKEAARLRKLEKQGGKYDKKERKAQRKLAKELAAKKEKLEKEQEEKRLEAEKQLEEVNKKEEKAAEKLAELEAAAALAETREIEMKGEKGKEETEGEGGAPAEMTGSPDDGSVSTIVSEDAAT